MNLTPSQKRIAKQNNAILQLYKQFEEEGTKKSHAVEEISKIMGVSKLKVYQTLKRNENGND